MVVIGASPPRKRKASLQRRLLFDHRTHAICKDPVATVYHMSREKWRKEMDGDYKIIGSPADHPHSSTYFAYFMASGGFFPEKVPLHTRSRNIAIKLVFTEDHVFGQVRRLGMLLTRVALAQNTTIKRKSAVHMTPRCVYCGY